MLNITNHLKLVNKQAVNSINVTDVMLFDMAMARRCMGEPGAFSSSNLIFFASVMLHW